MGISPETYTGENATISICSSNASSPDGETVDTYGIGDFTITLDRGIVEQELVGKAGNYFSQGAMSIDGSLTACRLDDQASGKLLGILLNSATARISGAAGTNNFGFYFKSAMITGFDISIGDAATITEGSIDFTLKYPYMVSSVGFKGNRAHVTDWGSMESP